MTETPSPVPRLGFAGTPEFAAEILAALLQANIPPHLILTQPDRPRGRGRRNLPCAVKQLALEWALDIHQPANLNAGSAHELMADIDLLIVAAYGLILPGRFLSIPRFGCINLHASLLPRWRGAAPVERAIMAGDTVSGITLMQMDAGLDTGQIIARAEYPITDSMTGDELRSGLAETGGKLLLRCLPEIGHLPRRVQPEAGVTYASKLTPADAEISWSDSSISLVNRIRALNSRLPAFSFLEYHGKSERVRLLAARVCSAECVDALTPPVSIRRVGSIVQSSALAIRIVTGDGLIDLSRIQLSRGKGKPMTVADALNGHADLFQPGKVFSSPGSVAENNGS